tara:strand:- start:728 stop:2311 length:1584 start_codon:yes stop_codon:yes gene_type:complete
MSKQQKTIKEIISEEYQRCYNDPVHFMKKYCQIQHPTKGRMPFNLYPFQEKSLIDLRKHQYNIILKSRQLGISTLSAGYSLWLMTFHKDKNVLVIATKQEVAKNLVTKVREMHSNLPSWLKGKSVEDNKLSLRYANGSQIKAVSAAGDAGRSEALSLLIVDEAAFIKEIDEIWASSQQTLSTGGQAIVLSTPNGIGNFFHKTWTKAESGDNKFNTIRLHWSLHPERDQAWRDEQDELLGKKLAAQECDCDFISSGDTVIDPEILQWYDQTHVEDPIEKRGFDGNFWIWEQPNYSRDYMVVADVARGDGADYSAFHVIDVESASQVAEYRGKIGTKEYGNFLVNVATEYNDALLVIENANVGWAAIQPAIDRSYQNLYYSYGNDGYTDAEVYMKKGHDMKDKSQMTAGFTTSARTRPLIISKLDIYSREKSCIIRSKRLIDELFVFIWNGNRPEAQKGYNDDLVISWSIGLWVRDTALKLRQQGIELNRKAIGMIGKSQSSVYTSENGNAGAWKMDVKGKDEDLRWLL